MKRETVEIQKEMFCERSSKLDKYCQLIVGKKGIARLFLYEFVQLFSAPPALWAF